MQSSVSTGSSLPDVREISFSEPFSWLAGGWSDFQKILIPGLIYGIGLAAISLALMAGILFTDIANWIMVLAAGFVFVAPMIAMGLYEAGRRLETGEKVDFASMLFVRTASARCLAYLGLALCLIYFFWTRMAQLVYGLSTYTVHKTTTDFLNFMLTTSEGWSMAITGTIVGAVIGLIAYSLVVVSAPMLLERKSDVFIATITSVRSVAKNPGPMLLWAIIIAILTAIGLATAGLGLIVIFPVIGLASWRAYRSLVVSSD